MINSSQENADINDLLHQIKTEQMNKKTSPPKDSGINKNSSDGLLDKLKSELQNKQENKAFNTRGAVENERTLLELKQQFHSKPSHQPLSDSEQTLTQLKQRLQTNQVTPKSSVESEQTLRNFKQQFQQQKEQQKPKRKSSVVNEQALGNLKQQFQQQKEAQNQQLTKQNQEEIRYAEQRKRQQEKLLMRQAEQWLEQLDKYSDEGLWFEEFARRYPSRLEAALEYLAILNAPS